MFNACADDERSDINNYDQTENLSNISTLKGSVQSIGELHNQGLGTIYSNVISGITNESITEVNTLVSESSWDYSNSIYPEIKDDELIMMDIHNSSYIGTYDTSNFSLELLAEINNLTSYVNNTINDTNTNAGQEIFDHSRVLLANPPSSLEGYELEAWKSAVDVMGYSAIYWFQNIESWELKMEGVSTAKCGWLCRLWKKIKPTVVADLAGATSGFVGGFIKSGGTWQSAGAGALVGGTAASAGSVVKELSAD